MNQKDSRRPVIGDRTATMGGTDSIPRRMGCANGCPLDYHEDACEFAGTEVPSDYWGTPSGRKWWSRGIADYSVGAAWITRDGRPVLVNLSEYDDMRRIPRQRPATGDAA